MTSVYRPMSFFIETERLSLRLRGPEDAECNLEILSEHEGGTTRNLADVRDRLVKQNEQAHQSGIGFLGITRRDQGDQIGYCGLFVGHYSFDEPEIGYEMLRRTHGYGYATEAASAVLEAAFATGRQRVWATVPTWNTPSIRVLKKIGFRYDHRISDEQGAVMHMVRDA